MQRIVWQDLYREPVIDKIVLIDAVDVHERAVVGDIVSKYILFYLGNREIICAGKIRDAHTLLKGNYPICLVCRCVTSWLLL